MRWNYKEHSGNVVLQLRPALYAHQAAVREGAEWGRVVESKAGDRPEVLYQGSRPVQHVFACRPPVLLVCPALVAIIALQVVRFVQP